MNGASPAWGVRHLWWDKDLIRLSRQTRLQRPLSYSDPMSELVFEVTQEADGGFAAEAIGENIVTEADSWDELRVNVREAVEAYYFDEPKPATIRLHLRRDEVLVA